MELVKEMKGKIEVIGVRGRIDSSTAPLFQSALEESIEAGHHHLLINLRQLEYLSSAGLRALYKSLGLLDALEVEGKIALCEPSQDVKKVLEFIDISADFPIFAREQDALKALC